MYNFVHICTLLWIWHATFSKKEKDFREENVWLLSRLRIAIYAPFEILKLPSFWHEKSPTFTFIIFLSNLTPMLEKEKPFDVFKRPLFKVYNFLKKKKTFSITKLLANQVNWNHFFIQKCGRLFSLFVFNLSWEALHSYRGESTYKIIFIIGNMRDRIIDGTVVTNFSSKIFCDDGLNLNWIST